MRNSRISSVLLASLATMTMLGSAPALTHYVPNAGSSIQTAINAAANGDTVMVGPDTYFESIDFLGKDITVVSWSGPYLTTIDGGGSGAVVTFSSGESLAALLEGFTITGSDTGIWIDYASPTVRDNIVEDNDPNSGIQVGYDAYPLIEKNIIRDNTGFNGAGISVGGADPVISENLIENNHSDGYGRGGAGIYVQSSGATLILSNVIRGNSSDTDGGGIGLMECTPTIVNNMILWNTASGDGGGLHVPDPHVVPIVTNNTIVSNIVLQGQGGGIYVRSSPYADTLGITNTIVRDNQAPTSPEIADAGGVALVTYSDIKGGWPGAGNIDADPLFVEAAVGDLHLTHDSPCKDSGTSAAPAWPSLDFEGDSRSADDGTDMGADEFHIHLYHTGDVIPGGTIQVRVVGPPSTPSVAIAMGPAVQDPPVPTQYGDLHLVLPVLWQKNLGGIGPSGVLTYGAVVPTFWYTGEDRPFQALVGPLGDPSSRLTNLMMLRVQ